VKTFDYIVIGAGSAGCVVANRLSAREGRRVLVLEAGGSDRKIEVRAPAGFPAQFQTALDWNYTSEPEPGLFGRRIYLPRGKVLGGCSSMNAMIYIRGHRADYDGWASEFGATGWSYDEVLPYFKRSEDNAEIHDEYHGTGGELHVTRKRWLSPHGREFVDAAVAAGIKANDDFNGASQDGAGVFQVTVKDGRRWSAASAFLRPAMKRKNVEVRTGVLVRRILVEGGRAVGVEYAHRGRVRRVRAESEIVLSAGAYGSPQILMLSGIGPADHLREVGIEPLVDSPNVGQHLQEHPLPFVNWQCRDANTLDDATSPKYVAPWLARGAGKLSSTVVESGVHWRSDDALPSPDFQFLFAPVYFWEHGFRKSFAPALTVAPSYIGPRSRGSVRLRSADPAAPPRILNNMLTHDSEVDAVLKAIDLARDIATASPFAGSITGELNPGPSVRSRQELTDWLRATCEHTYHPACTARMGTAEDGVVDPQLRVHGVDGLRVADTSVMPKITSGNTNAPTIMIGERCADFVLGKG
jgi:choline dehydrogenase-like flavoprotein